MLYKYFVFTEGKLKRIKNDYIRETDKAIDHLVQYTRSHSI